MIDKKILLIVGVLLMVLVREWSVQELARVDMIASVPAPGEHLTAPLDAVSLTFGQSLGAEPVLKVTDARGVDVTGPVKEFDARRRVIRVEAFDPGRYEVRWAVRVHCGRVSTGMFHFVLEQSQ